MEKRFPLLFRHLYATLTTSQIERALRSAGLTQKDWLEFCQSMKNDASIWVNDLPDVEKARIENHIRSKLKTEGYSQQEIDVAVDNALDSKISDILHVLVD